MFEGVAKQISDLTQVITSICELLSKLAPRPFQNAVCSLNKSVENLNREGSFLPTMSAVTSSPGKAERKRKGKESVPSPEGATIQPRARPRLAPSQTID